MAALLSPDQPDLRAQLDVTARFIDDIRDKYMDTLNTLSLGNVETEISTLAMLRRLMPVYVPLPFFRRSRLLESTPIHMHDRFALSAMPDDFITSNEGSPRDQERLYHGEKHYGDLIQRLEYQNTGGYATGGGDDLPVYVFQLGRLVLPATGGFAAQKLPFVAVVDILDPRKAVWLVHVPELDEDEEEKWEWYPSQYALDQLKCLFDGSYQRHPAYHLAQVAPSLEKWMSLDYDTLVHNIENERHRGNLKLKLTWREDFSLAIQGARNRAVFQLVSTHGKSGGGPHKLRDIKNETVF